MGESEEGREALGRVVGRLNRVYPWLVIENSDKKVKVEMLSENRFDPRGRPSVQCCLKKEGNKLLLIAVNTIGTGVEAMLGLADYKDISRGRTEGCREVFSGEDYAARDGKLRVKFGPYETKAFLSADYAD